MPETNTDAVNEYKAIFDAVKNPAISAVRDRRQAEKAARESRDEQLAAETESFEAAQEGVRAAQSAMQQAFDEKLQELTDAHNEAQQAITEVYDEKLREVREQAKSAIRDAARTATTSDS